MSKSIGIVTTTILLTICLVFGAGAAFSLPVFAEADGFQLVDSNPHDGYTKVQPANVMIKLNFSEAISAERSQKANKKAFKFTDSEGKSVDYTVIYNSKDENNVNLVVNGDLQPATDYIVTVSSGFTDNKGDILGKDQVLKFSTKKADTGLTYMLLMGAMIVLMVGMTFRDQRKAAQAESDANPTLTITSNPYKLAKEKNISVEEANKLIEAERAKVQKKQDKLAEKSANAAQSQQKSYPVGKNGKKVYKVKTKRTTKMQRRS